MNLPEFGVKRPITNLMIFSGIIIISLYSLSRLGIDMMPEIEPPAITVVSAYPGASPEDTEIRVTEPLENQLASTPGLEKITSRSMEGLSLITLKFGWDVNLDEASNDIRDRIDRSKRFLPDIPSEMDNPFVFKFNTAMMPIVFFGVSADETYPLLYDLIDKRICDPLRQIPGVGTVQLMGGLERQINVWIDGRRLEGFGFSILDVRNALAMQNVTQPVGNIKTGMTDYLLRLPGEFVSPADIDLVIVGRRDGHPVYLKDIARIEDAFKEVTGIVRINGHRGLMLMVQKQTGVNTVTVSRRVKARVESLRDTLPADVKLRVIRDASVDIIAALKSLKSTVWTGAALVILVTWFFLRRLMPSLIIALTIPFSLLIAFIYLFLSGRTINVISLTSLTMAIGMVVDNAIVVVDNVLRHLDKGKRVEESAIFGTREMFLAVAASTATTVVVFLPMLFVSGVVGIMFGELSVIICVTLIASLFTAATFTPMLCSKWLKPVANKEAAEGQRPAVVKRQHRIYDISERWFESWESGYSQALAWSLRHKKMVLIGFSAAFVASLLLVRLVGTEFIPEEDSGDMQVTAALPVGTRLEETDKTAARIEKILEADVSERLVSSVRFGRSSGMGAVFGGAGGSHVLSGGVKLQPKTERKRSAKEIAQSIRKKVREIPGVMKTDVTTGDPLGTIITGMGGKSVQIEILGNSFEDTDKAALEVKTVMTRVKGTVDVSISRDLRRPELGISVDREKAAALGLDMRMIAQTISACVEGSVATRYREQGETYDVLVRLEEDSRSSPEDISQLTVVSPLSGNQIKLANFAEVRETVGPIEIERQNRERVLRVECNTHERPTGKVVGDLRKELANLNLPAGVTLRIGGQAEEQTKAFKDLTFLLLLGIALVYMVMAAQFESLLEPFVVMFAMPFTFTGVILGFVFTHTTLSVITFLGIVMLMGIVVNNAIVLISYINILRARGFSMRDAVTQGGQARLRPVLMTTITTLAGMLPLALSHGQGSESWQPLGITMISGLTVSTIVTMIFVPTLYATFEGRLRNRRRAV